MQVQIHTDDHIEGREALLRWVEDEVRSKLARLSGELTRIDVHLGDENAGKAGEADKRCRIEARLANHPPTTVTHHAGSLADALHGATDKMRRLLDSTLERLRDRGRESIRHGDVPVALDVQPEVPPAA